MLEAIMHQVFHEKNKLTMEKLRKMLAYVMLRYSYVFELEMDEYLRLTGDTLENYTRSIEKSEMWCDMMMIGMYPQMHSDN